MRFIFHPQRSDRPLTLAVAKDVLTLNGEAFDFSALPEGGVLPPAAIKSDMIAGPVRRENGQIVVELILPHGAAAQTARRFPVARTQRYSGPVDLPHDESLCK